MSFVDWKPLVVLADTKENLVSKMPALPQTDEKCKTMVRAVPYASFPIPSLWHLLDVESNCSAWCFSFLFIAYG